jgi:hypothetical protein
LLRANGAVDARCAEVVSDYSALPVVLIELIQPSYRTWKIVRGVERFPELAVHLTVILGKEALDTAGRVRVLRILSCVGVLPDSGQIPSLLGFTSH